MTSKWSLMFAELARASLAGPGSRKTAIKTQHWMYAAVVERWDVRGGTYAAWLRGKWPLFATLL